jgi:uncharacterized protein
MKALFADTLYFVALAGPNDSSHAAAVDWSERWQGRIITTEYVLAETGSILSRPADRAAFVNLVRDLQADPLVHITPSSRALFRAGFDLFATRLDKEWSLVDCMSIVVMKQRRLKEALITDSHFAQAGFRALLT